ncbi:MAG: PEP-CTERM sorting domain-containing protein [Anaerolineaceae bacterium]|nr:PEP-CTERM sorting domain-containing protein [Anaerolineaceae bacterium]
MKRLLSGLLCAVVVVACSAVAVQAAQIVFTGNDTATGVDWIVNGTPGLYGNDTSILWDISSGRPDYTQDPTMTPANPSYIASFTYGNSGGGGGGGGGGGNNSGGGGGTTGINYDLVMNEDKTFDFEVLFYDADYTTRNAGLGVTLVGTDVALAVRLVDPSANPGSNDGWQTITVGELEGGVYMIWNVEASAGETITTEVVWVNGDGVGAAAFFLDNVVDGVTVPEPATISFIAFGLGAIFIRRRK